MATGIVSTAADRFHFPVIGVVLLVIAAAAFASLFLLYAWKLIGSPAEVRREFSSAKTSFGFFALVAGAAVLGERLDELHHPLLGLALFSLAALGWLLFTYSIPARQILLQQKRGPGEIMTGDWLLWVVATQSIATIASMLAVHQRGLAGAMSVVAVWAWSVGVLLYLVLITILMVRLFTAAIDAVQMSASYWISMGATAITTLAGGRILGLSHRLPLLLLMSPVVGGVSFMLWCFGTWWIPLLIVFGIWRHWLERHPVRYDREFWSIVFPLGMYATASAEFGGEANLGFMYQLGSWMFWPALLAWVLVSLGMLRSIVRLLARTTVD